MMSSRILCVTFLLGIFGGVGSTELCYVDATGNGVYCDPNCCGNPVYCCDKDSITIQSAAFGTLGVLMIIVMIFCVVRKKLRKKKLSKQDLPVCTKVATVSVPVATTGTAAMNGGPAAPLENQGSFRREGTSHACEAEAELSLPNIPITSEAPTSNVHTIVKY